MARSAVDACNRRAACAGTSRVYVAAILLAALARAQVSVQSSLRAPSTGACGVGDYRPQTYLGGSGADLPRKKCAIWTDGPSVKASIPKAPRNRNSGLIGPHTTPPIVNYKYDIYHEGCFGLPALGT